MAKKGNNQRSAPARSNPAPSRGASPATMQAFAASNPNSRTAAAIAPRTATVQTNAGPNPMGSPSTARTTPEVKGVGQGLRIAGGDGGITRGELNTILDTSKMDSGKVIGRLDAVNAKLKANDKTGINLRSGAANMLINQASKSTPKGRGYRPVDFGKGAIGTALQGMLGSRASGGYINNKSGQQFFTPGVEPTLLARGMDLMPSGRQTVRGMGKQYQVPERFMPKTDPGVEDITNTVDGTDGTDAIPTLPVEEVELEKEKEEEKQDININMPGSPFDLASWATGFKTARSSRKRAGRGAQGLASNRVAPTRNVIGI